MVRSTTGPFGSRLAVRAVRLWLAFSEASTRSSSAASPRRRGRDAAACLAACSQRRRAGRGRPPGDPDAPAKLTFWTWTTGIDKVVAIWNRRTRPSR